MSALDREKAREVLARTYTASVPNDVLDALEACVVPAPPQTINRAELIGVLLNALRGTTVSALPLAAEILALVQPVEGVTLTPKEASLALGAIEDAIVDTHDRALLASLGALAHRLDPDFPAPEDDEDAS